MIYFKIIIAVIFFIIALKLKNEGFYVKKLLKKKDEKNNTKDNIDELSFYEEYKRLQNNREKKTLKLKKQMTAVTYILLIISIMPVVIYNIFFVKLNILISIIDVIVIFFILFTCIIMGVSLCGIEKIIETNEEEANEEEELKKKFYRDVFTPLLQVHGYTNVCTGKFTIQDKKVGLVHGDELVDTMVGVSCDQFKYEKLRYYHEEVYTDENGYERRETKITFVGFEIFIPYNTGLSEAVRIIPSITKNGKEKIFTILSQGRMQDEEHIDIEDIEFNENFEVYSKSAHLAYYFLNSERIEYLKLLRRKNLISIVVNKDGLYIATNRKTSILEVPSVQKKEDISKDRFEREFKEFENFIGEYKKII